MTETAIDGGERDLGEPPRDAGNTRPARLSPARRIGAIIVRLFAAAGTAAAPAVEARLYGLMSEWRARQRHSTAAVSSGTTPGCAERPAPDPP